MPICMSHMFFGSRGQPLLRKMGQVPPSFWKETSETQCKALYHPTNLEDPIKMKSQWFLEDVPKDVKVCVRISIPLAHELKAKRTFSFVKGTKMFWSISTLKSNLMDKALDRRLNLWIDSSLSQNQSISMLWGFMADTRQSTLPSCICSKFHKFALTPDLHEHWLECGKPIGWGPLSLG